MAVVFATAGCARKSDESPERIVVILDYLPGPIHAGLYAAQARGDYTEAGLEVEFLTPTSTSETLRLMAAGQADVGLGPLLDFFQIRSEKRPFRLLLALVQTPLNAIIVPAESPIQRPRDLIGRTIATTGILGDEIIVRSLVERDGGDPSQVELLNVGFNTVQALAAGRVDAAFGFWNAEGIQYASEHPARILRSEDYGIPAYPEIVCFVREERWEKRKEALERFAEITRRSYERLLEQPDEALRLFATSVDGYDETTARPYFEALLPVFQGQAETYGSFYPAVLEATMQWLANSGFPTPATSVDELLAR